MNRLRIAQLRRELDAERISYGELAEIDEAFEQIDPETLPEPAENAMAGDKLDELEARAEDVYDPFPGIPHTNPTWYHSGICYSRVQYATKDEADRVGAFVRSQGGTVNGGFMHGAPLGQVSGSDEDGWEVTC